jgi:hypothetical protein
MIHAAGPAEDRRRGGQHQAHKTEHGQRTAEGAAQARPKECRPPPTPAVQSGGIGRRQAEVSRPGRYRESLGCIGDVAQVREQSGALAALAHLVQGVFALHVADIAAE